ncbi:MAG: DsbA family protein [Proteobacteria bacterium]|nr:DsbA family protein [Pseudomonadota bacterium]
MSRIELWFDFSCPYAYLASRQAASLGVPIDWRPMLLGGVFRGIGAGDGPMSSLSMAKAAHNLRDMYRWAELFEAPFAMPAAHPMRTVRALRVLLALPHATWPDAIPAIYAAYWQRGEDVTSDAVIRAALEGAAVASDDVLHAFARADDDDLKAELHARTAEAIELGIFGAPAWIVRRADPARAPLLVWGQDRLAHLAAILDGWEPEEGPPPGGPRPFSTALRAHDGAMLDVYFDVSSPFAYLALTQVARLADQTGVVPRLVPILLGALFKELGTANVPLFTFPPPKLRYTGLEMTRWGHWWGEPVRMPRKFPQRTITAQRLCILAADRGWRVQLELAVALARAMWRDDRDLEDVATLGEILDACGLPRAWLEGCSDPAVKQALIDATAAARAVGVFGVPSFVVDDTLLVWGQDRLDLVARALGGWKPAHG